MIFAHFNQKLFYENKIFYGTYIVTCSTEINSKVQQQSTQQIALVMVMQVSATESRSAWFQTSQWCQQVQHLIYHRWNLLAFASKQSEEEEGEFIGWHYVY